MLFKSLGSAEMNNYAVHLLVKFKHFKAKYGNQTITYNFQTVTRKLLCKGIPQISRIKQTEYDTGNLNGNNTMHYEVQLY